MTRWEELGMTAEDYLQSRWVSVDVDPLYGVTIKGCCVFAGAIVSKHLSDTLAAATYTAEHEEAIRQKREEIGWLKEMRVHPSDIDKPQRILAVLEGQLEGMLKGWKG